MIYEEYLNIAKEQVAADYCLDMSVFDGGPHIVAPKPFGECARKTKTGKPFLDIVYFGKDLIAAADGSIARYVSDLIKRCGANTFRIFDAPEIFELERLLERHGYTVGEIAQGFLPSDRVECVADGKEFAIEELYGEEIKRLYAYKEFGEALCYSADDRRRDIIATAYYDNGRPVAVAACSNDGEKMYQIGVDVLVQYRGRGLASALVKKLSFLTAKSGKCPYYRCAWSNIASRRTAIACGYADAWVELSASKI